MAARLQRKPWAQDFEQKEVIQKLKQHKKVDERNLSLKDTFADAQMKGSEKGHKGKNQVKVNGGKTRIQQLAESLSIPDELPQLPDQLRTFAFRYATEPRKHMDWAAIFHVSIYTIRRWLLKREVMQYILKVRRDRQLLMLERLSNLEKKAYKKLDDILSLPVTEDTAEIIRKTILDVLTIKGGAPLRGPSISINQQQSSSSSSSSLSSAEKNMTVGELKDRIEEMDAIDELLDKEEEE